MRKWGVHIWMSIHTEYIDFYVQGFLLDKESSQQGDINNFIEHWTCSRPHWLCTGSSSGNWVSIGCLACSQREIMEWPTIGWGAVGKFDIPFIVFQPQSWFCQCQAWPVATPTPSCNSYCGNNGSQSHWWLEDLIHWLTVGWTSPHPQATSTLSIFHNQQNGKNQDNSCHFPALGFLVLLTNINVLVEQASSLYSDVNK